MGVRSDGRRAMAPARRDEPEAGLVNCAREASLHQARTLLQTVENEIIPRLMLLHRREGAAVPAPHANGHPSRETSDRDVAEFTGYLLRDESLARTFVHEQASAGVTVPSLCLGLLAPAARRLGDLWDRDLCDFTQVTIALGRLHSLMRGLAGGMPASDGAGRSGRHVVFASAPGEQHTFGLTMVRDFFFASGWQAWNDLIDEPKALLALLRSRHFDLLGLSIGSERHADALAALIVQARRVSMNPNLRVLVGGPWVLEGPAAAGRLGADATADDARAAILVADRMMTAQGHRR